MHSYELSIGLRGKQVFITSWLPLRDVAALPSSGADPSLAPLGRIKTGDEKINRQFDAAQLKVLVAKRL